jgi:hypothetical protein
MGIFENRPPRDKAQISALLQNLLRPPLAFSLQPIDDNNFLIVCNAPVTLNGIVPFTDLQYNPPDGEACALIDDHRILVTTDDAMNYYGNGLRIEAGQTAITSPYCGPNALFVHNPVP